MNYLKKKKNFKAENIQFLFEWEEMSIRLSFASLGGIYRV